MKATLKKGLYIIGISALVSLMASCLGGNDDTGIYSLTDAELLNFWLFSPDSLPELEKVVFSIDNSGEIGLIYNYDSMAYGTELPEKVQLGYFSGAGFDNVLNITNGDSIWLKQSDSIDISVPQTLRVYALDGKTTKQYIAQLNIHQMDPDSMQYSQIASDLSFLQTEDTKTVVFNDHFLTYSRIEGKIQLHSAQDAVLWMGRFSGLPDNAVIGGIQSNGSQLFAYTDDGELYTRYDLTDDQWILVDRPESIKIKSILGYLNEGPKQSEGLSLIIETGGINTFAFTSDFIHWEYDSITPVPVPDDFPVYGFSNHSYQLMLTERITIFGGTSMDGTAQNTVWSTENGLYWAKLRSHTNVFPPLSNANIFYYDNEFWLINGKIPPYYNRGIYYSRDGGVTWQEKSWWKYDLPEVYTLRYGASLVMDKDKKYFFIIGGRQEDGVILSDIWKGQLNKMEFEH